MSRELPLFGSARLQMDDSIEMTIQSLLAYGPEHPHCCIAYSGGKDSTALVTLVVTLIEQGRVPRPETLTVLYADTRLELLPLAAVAADTIEQMLSRGIDTRVVMASLDRRFLTYVLGRGVPPPNNGTLRWCTRQIKVEPMAAAIKQILAEREGRILMLTGVREGESAVRDGRIATSCTKDGGECGQGWFQRDLAGGRINTLAPILHWRICHVWEWLWTWAPSAEWGDWNTQPLAEAYGGRDGDEAAELEARTGCTGCPLAEKDLVLNRLIATPRWAYLAPLKQLRPLWRELRKAEHRLRKDGSETRKDGSLVANPGRWGPIRLESRLWALGEVLRIQSEVNAGAIGRHRPRLDLLNAEEESRIRALIDARTFPEKWTGNEIGADEMIDETFHAADGSVVVQALLPGLLTRGPR